MDTAAQERSLVDPLIVFANTGHQYFKIDLEKLFPKKPKEWFKQFVRENRESWNTWDEYTRWVRYQYEYDALEDKYYLNIAVETNLGEPTRGTLYRATENVADQIPAKSLQAQYADVIDNVFYAAGSEAQIEEFFVDRKYTLTYLPQRKDSNKPQIETRIDIFWRQPDGETLDVDLIVDLGNTRTIALLLENKGQRNSSLAERIHPVRFVPWGNPYECRSKGDPEGESPLDEYTIIDSWLVLFRPLYAHLEPPKSDEKLTKYWVDYVDPRSGKRMYRENEYLPDSFVELSPALIGGGFSTMGARKVLASFGLRRGLDARYYLSSPKRYVWDQRPTGVAGDTFWKQIPADTDNAPVDFFTDLGGLIREFMDPGGLDRGLDQPRDEEYVSAGVYRLARPSYPRCDAVCWFALSILETAYRQINAQRYLEDTGASALPRRLRHIRLTYPAGWTNEERSRYFDLWQRAINLFTISRFPNYAPSLEGGERPVLPEYAVDEAVASQLPILYADIDSLRGGDYSWFDLYGTVERDDDGTPNGNQSVTVMNVDIGGGTTDIAIIQYQRQQRGGSRHHKLVLEPRLLFRDGNKIAGDRLVKAVIERVLLPAWAKAAGADIFEYHPHAKERIQAFFYDPLRFQKVDPKGKEKLTRNIRLSFIPLVNELLRRLAGDTWEAIRVGDYADPTMVNELNELLRQIVNTSSPASPWKANAFPHLDTLLKCDRAAIVQCIDEVFGPMLNSLAMLVGQFDCQLVIVSGKPSELPRVRQLMLEAFPILPQRIISVKNFPAGSWYPFRSKGKIFDAKTCTVVGAALYQEMLNGTLEAFSIAPEHSQELSCHYYWGVLPPREPEKMYDRANLLIRPDLSRTSREEDERLIGPIRIPLNCRIGRQIARVPGIAPDPVYQLVWRPANRTHTGHAEAEVTLRWYSRRGEGECLQLVNVTPVAEYPEVQPDDYFALELNTMEDESFWLDDPKFEVDGLYS